MTIFDEIESAIKEIAHGWTTLNKGKLLAAAVIALRPSISVEIGVWAGKGMISLALAHKHIGHGMVYGVDPYSPEASADGQVNPADKEWWSKADHELFYNIAKNNIIHYGCQNVCKLERKRSDDFEPPKNIGILVVDGNHGDESISDFKRYCPNVARGGLMFADDLNWSGGSVSKAVSLAGSLGFKELYTIENKDENFGVFQKIK